MIYYSTIIRQPVYLFILRVRKREAESGRERRGRERERIPRKLLAVSVESDTGPDMGLESTNLEIST